MLPTLDARLAAAAELVRPGEPVADIGCDHGKLTAVLAASGKYPKVIGADLRPGPLAKAEQTLEHSQRTVVGYHFLEAHCGYMQLRHRGRHVGISLVGAHHDVASGSNAEVGARHACVGRHKLVAQAYACLICKICGVIVALLASEHALKEMSHLFLRDMYGRHYDVARLLLHKLQDALAEVCLNDVYAVLLEEGVHLALLRQHRLALHELLYVVRREYFKHNVVKLFCVFCPVNLHSVLLGICGKLLKIFVKMRYGVALYGASRVAQAFPLV